MRASGGDVALRRHSDYPWQPRSSAGPPSGSRFEQSSAPHFPCNWFSSSFSFLFSLPPLLKSWRAELGMFGSFSSSLLPRITLDWCRNPATSHCSTAVLKSTTSWMTGTRCSLGCNDPTPEYRFLTRYGSLHPCPELPFCSQSHPEGCRVPLQPSLFYPHLTEGDCPHT